MKIEPQTERAIKEAANIVDVVSDFVTLRKSGVNYQGLCPFHEDRHLGSFIVSPAKNICTCFACNITYGPVDFLMNYGGGMRYPDALAYLARKYFIALDGSTQVPTPKKQEPVAPLPTLTLPMSMVKAKLSLEGNPLAAWLRSLPWEDEDRQMLEYWMKLYYLGTSDTGRTAGWPIFWYVDAEGNVRTGKMMKYLDNGHRDRESRYNFDFVHSILLRNHMWDDKAHEMHMCLFGLHLVDAFPDAEVCIVESEKTALIAQTLSNPGAKLFMATGSKGTLKKEMLQPLIDRNRWIILYPDVDGLEEWRKKAKEMKYNRIQVTDQVAQNYKPEDGEKADIADILLRKMLEKKRTTTYEEAKGLMGLTEEHKPLKTLIEQLELRIKK